MKKKLDISYNFIKIILKSLTRSDFIKFLVYFIFFSVMFFISEKAKSPEWQLYDLNSASKENKSVFIDLSDNYELWNKENQQKPILTLEFNPDNVKIDENLIKWLKLNIESKVFKNKVTPLNLTIDSVRTNPRWQVLWWKLILSWNIKDIKESIKVFVHELWHIVDLYFLSNIWDYDPSENFYNISRVSYNTKKTWSRLNDFVSWYSLTNKYEDFAESFSFYIFHNEEFKKRAKDNFVLQKKYNFFENYIFINNEFSGTFFENSSIKAYNWDSTKITINLKKYLYYIK